VPRSFVQLAPDARPVEAARILAAAGWARHNNWARLARNTAHPPAHVSRLRIEAIGPERAEIFGSICGTAFKLPELIARWAGAARRPARLDALPRVRGTEPVGTAALRIDGAIAWFGYAATLAAARGRGAQSALIARRLSDAARLGCTHAVVETAEDLPDAPSTSLRNLRRQGFEQVYLRANYMRVRKPA
jgi:GNAT superfamily N-acetyltransferase